MPSEMHKEFLPTVIGLVRGIRKRFNARASAIDMTYSRAQALVMISNNEGATQAELADKLDIQTPSMNRTLDYLEEQGLIERRPVPEDRRVRTLYLTPAAHARADRIVTFTQDLRREVYKDVTPEELEQALAVIRRIQKNLEGMGC